MGRRPRNRAPPQVEQLVDALIDGKLAWYLLDTDTANELIKEIAEETRLPRAAVRIAFKLLAPLLIKKGRDAGGWFGHKLIGRSTGLLVKLPGYELVAGKLLSLHAKLDADVTRRRQLDAILAGERPASDLKHAEGLSKDLRLGLRELAELEEMRAYIGDQFDRLFDILNPQPPLILKLLERTEINRLKFGARRVPFFGRRAEMERLCDFLGTPGAFSWWLVTGRGGQGKSRLAVEFCLRAGTAWRVGILAGNVYLRWLGYLAARNRDTDCGRLRRYQTRAAAWGHREPAEPRAYGPARGTGSPSAART